MDFLMIPIYALLIAILCLAAYYSFKYRRQTNAALRGKYAAKMNIYLGLLLVLLAIIQLFIFEPSKIRMGVGLVFFLLGLFNLFSGIRNHMYYSRQIR